MRKLLFSLVIISLLGSCKESDETKPVVVDDLYSVEIPVFMEEGTDLHEDASLQYQNLVKELYIVVIHEPKDEVNEAIGGLMDAAFTPDLDGYTNFLLDQVELNVGIRNKSEIDNKVINSMDAKIVSLESTIDGHDIFYTFSFIEGKNTYYQVMTWTLLDSKDRFKDKMLKMIQSFKEV